MSNEKLQGPLLTVVVASESDSSPDLSLHEFVFTSTCLEGDG